MASSAASLWGAPGRGGGDEGRVIKLSTAPRPTSASPPPLLPPSILASAKTEQAASLDPSRRVGCVIFRPDDGATVIVAHNHLSRGLDADDAANIAHPRKGFVWCHAEADAVSVAAANGVALEGMYVACTSWPCDACAHALLGARVAAIYVPVLDLDASASKWTAAWRAVQEMCVAAGVPLIQTPQLVEASGGGGGGAGGGATV